MSKIITALFYLFSSAALAQTAPTPPSSDNSNRVATTAFVRSAPVSSTQLPAFTNDCTSTAGTSALTCLKTNGVLFSSLATTVPGAGVTTALSSAPNNGVGFSTWVTVPNNTSLSSLPSTTPTATRQGFTSAGDSPYVNFTAIGSACSLNSGAGDGFSQVPTSDGKCWIASLPQPIDVRIAGVDTTGSEDSTSKINGLISAGPANGTKLFFPCGTYKITNSIGLGNGNSTTVATRQGVVIEGSSDVATTPYLGGVNSTSCVNFNWAGGFGGTMFSVNGPLWGWGIKNVNINCNNIAAVGILISSGSRGNSENVTINQCRTDGVQSIPYDSANFGGIPYNNEKNEFRNFDILVADVNGARGVLLGGPSSGQTSTDFNTWINTSIVLGSTGGNAVQGIYAQVSDSNIFYNLHIFGTSTAGSTAWLNDYSANGVYPASNQIYGFDCKLQGSGLSFRNVGIPSYQFVRPSQLFGALEANGCQYPNITGWQVSLPMKMWPDVLLTNQTAAISGTNIGQAYLSGMYRICWYMSTTTVGTAGTYNINLGWNDGTAKSVIEPALSATLANGSSRGCETVYHTALQNITYSTSLTGVTGSLSYLINITTERLN